MQKPELLIDGLDFGEGPRWHDGLLWYSDFFQHSVYTVSPDGRRELVLDLDTEQPSGLGWLPNGDLLVAVCVLPPCRILANRFPPLDSNTSMLVNTHSNFLDSLCFIFG